MFRLFINSTDHGTFDTVTDALNYIQGEIEACELETIEAEALEISIVK